jgi:hypothetical protein
MTGAESKEPEDFYRTENRLREFDRCFVPETAIAAYARAFGELILGCTS